MRRIRLSDLWIVGWILFQIGLPLSWYLRGGGADERFAWRMFSAQHLTRCELRYTERAPGIAETTEQRLDQLVQGTWVKAMTKGRPAVIDAFLSYRCAQGASELTLERKCGTVSETYRQRCEPPP